MARGGFPGIPGGNMQQLMRQAQKMQQQMVQMQQELDERVYEGQASGMVTCTINGKRELLSLSIKPEVIDPEDVEMLQDMIIVAINDALRKGEETREKEMARIGGSGMSGLF